MARPTKPSPTLAAAVGAAGLLAAALQRGRPAPEPPPRLGPRHPRHPDRRHHGRHPGHDADSPLEIPARGWWQILKRTAAQASEDRLLTEAAGVTFYTLLAVFPAIAALVSIYGLFADPTTIWQNFSGLEGVVPGGGMEVLKEQVQRIASKGPGTLGFGLAIGLATSIWSANQAIKAMFDALNVVFEEKECRSWIMFTLQTLAFTFCSLLFILLAIGAVVALPIILKFIGFGSWAAVLLRWARWPLLLVLLTLYLACLYRFGPCRRKPRWRWVTWGGAFASLLWILISGAFSYYVSNFGNYNATYGSLGAVVGFMTWIWISATVVLAGAELDAEMEHQTERDSTTGQPKPMGQRGARMADTVAR